jgi:hypothetical protein
METTQKFEGWAVVEMLGHKQLAGMVTEQVLAGAALIRVDVPETTHSHDVSGFGGRTVTVKPAYTKFIGVGSIYCITPCTEETCRRAATVLERWNDPIPVQLPQLLTAGASVAGSSDDSTDADVVDDDIDDEDLFGDRPL